LRVEEFDHALALADDLRGHAATAATAAATAETTAAAAAVTAATAAAEPAATAAAIATAATAEAITAAAVAAAAAIATTAAAAATVAAAAVLETAATATETVVATETVALVSAAPAALTATSFIKTHAVRIFPAPETLFEPLRWAAHNGFGAEVMAHLSGPYRIFEAIASAFDSPRRAAVCPVSARHSAEESVEPAKRVDAALRNPQFGAMSLDPDLLLRAYSIGVFPMSDSRHATDIFWVEPKRRAILPLDAFRMSRTLRKTLRADTFQVTCDRAFAQVLRCCSDREETWINEQIEVGFNRLHGLGHAHSIECWQDGALVGGLYGVKLGAAFFGESMFSARTDASKVALSWLVARLTVGGFALLDCQFMTDHLRSLGAVEIRQSDYVTMLSAALDEGASAGADFGALDPLLASAGAAASPGCVIAQLLGQTS
jgi:leucyl/phenylalanyl-tRNA--protein transferase